MQKLIHIGGMPPRTGPGQLRAVWFPAKPWFHALTLAVLVLAPGGCSRPKPAANAPTRGGTSLRSPNGTLEVSVNVRQTLSYTVRIDDLELVRSSKLGLLVREGGELGNDVDLLTAEHRYGDETWTNPWGKRRQVRDHYNELRVVLRERRPGGRVFEVIFRAYDDGIAFRYVLPAQDGLGSFVLDRELTEFAFGGDYACFAGQQEKGFQGAQEWEFKPGVLSGLKPESIVGLPLLVQTPAAWVAIAESDLRDWAGLWLCGGPPSKSGTPGVTLATRLAPRPDQPGAVVGETPQSSPWRVLMIGREPGRLIESDLILNLAAPCQWADTSWNKPGKMAWDHC